MRIHKQNVTISSGYNSYCKSSNWYFAQTGNALCNTEAMKDRCFLRYNTTDEAERARIRFVSLVQAFYYLIAAEKRRSLSRIVQRSREKGKGESRNRSRPCQKAKDSIRDGGERTL